jgi:predicted MPP superfamily phosphohydrolase
MLFRFLVVLGIILLAEYYSYIAIRTAISSLPAATRTAIVITYFLLTAITWAGVLFFRSINWASMPHLLRNIYIAFTIGFIVGKVLILLVMLVDELRRLYQYLTRSQVPANTSPGSDVIPRSAFLSRLALLLGAGILTGFVYGITNRYRYKVRQLRLAFPSLPASFRGLKIVHISDIHTGSFDNHEAVAQGITQVMDQKPDLILFTGDLVNNHALEVDERYRQIFSRLKAPMGVYSVLGNHDYGDYTSWPSAEAKKANLDLLKKIQADMGWQLLMNEHILLQRGDEQIALMGIENWGAKGNFPKYGDMAKAHAGLNDKKVPFKILMSHDPSHWDAQVRTQYPDVNLTLSGHTHGMQFGIEIPGIKWSPIQYMYKQWGGLYTEGKQSLYVNRGFGFLGYPGRLGILPEITVLELV